MDEKILIRLTPFAALSLIEFLRLVDYDMPGMNAIGQAVDQFECQVHLNLSDEDIEDAIAERAVNKLLGKEV